MYGTATKLSLCVCQPGECVCCRGGGGAADLGCIVDITVVQRHVYCLCKITHLPNTAPRLSHCLQTLLCTSNMVSVAPSHKPTDPSSNSPHNNVGPA
jgi:hypothetical protein